MEQIKKSVVNINIENLASRSSRLVAKVIDVIIVFFGVWFFIPNYFYISVVIDMIISLLGIVLNITQLVILTKYGQSIGKKILKIKIVKIEDSENGGFVTNIIKRGLVNAIISIVPIYSLVDILFIFKSDRRCIHDLIAGTKVIKVLK